MADKEPLLRRGEPAPETDLGRRIQAEALLRNSLDGQAVPEYPIEREEIDDNYSPRISRETNHNIFKDTMRQWILRWSLIIYDNYHFPLYFREMYHSLKETIIDRAPLALDNNYYWHFLTTQVRNARYSVEIDWQVLKYWLLFLNKNFEYFCSYLDITPNRVEESNKQLKQEHRRQEQEAKDKVEHEKLQEYFTVGDATKDIF